MPSLYLIYKSGIMMATNIPYAICAVAASIVFEKPKATNKRCRA
jgi:hypothetical protein